MRGPELLTYDLGQGACAFSTERRGGYSEGAYASFNANAYCGDDERMVRLNRDLLCEALGLETSRLIIPHQIHGARVRRIDEAFFMQTDAVKAVTLEGVDAVMTDVPKVCVSVSTADCIPILIYDRVHHAVAAVHAGWRSTVLRIPEAVLQAMAGAYGNNRPCAHQVKEPAMPPVIPPPSRQPIVYHSFYLAEIIPFYSLSSAPSVSSFGRIVNFTFKIRRLSISSTSNS